MTRVRVPQITIHCVNASLANEIVQKLRQLFSPIFYSNTNNFIYDLQEAGKEICKKKNICCDLQGTDFYFYNY